MASNDYSFVWSGNTTNTYSSANREFSVLALGGIRLLSGEIISDTNPTGATGIGNRGFNDARYTLQSAGLSATNVIIGTAYTNTITVINGQITAWSQVAVP